jgi:hypothetical protein
VHDTVAAMRVTVPTLLLVSAIGVVLTGCPKAHPDVDWLKPPKSYDPIDGELTLNKAAIDTFTLKEGEDQAKFIESLQGEGEFVGQAKCQSGVGTGELDVSQYGEYQLTCNAGTILFDIELKYTLFTSRDAGKPLSANAYVEFTGTLVGFSYHDESKPRSIAALVKVDELSRLSD